MARFSGVAKGWKYLAIFCVLLLLAVIGICIASGVIAGQENITFFEALSNIFGGTNKVVDEEIVENTEQVVTAIIKLI